MSEYRDQLVAREQRIAALEEELADKDRKLAELQKPLREQDASRRAKGLKTVTVVLGMTAAVAFVGALILVVRTTDRAEVQVTTAPIEVWPEQHPDQVAPEPPVAVVAEHPTKAFYREKLMPMGGSDVWLANCFNCPCCEDKKPPSAPDATCSACILRELFERGEMTATGLGEIVTWMASHDGHAKRRYAGVKVDGKAQIVLDEPAQHVGVRLRRTGNWRTWNPDDLQLSMTAYDVDGNVIGEASTSDPEFTEDNAAVGRNEVFLGLYSVGIVNIQRVSVLAAPDDVIIELVRAYIPGWSRGGPNVLDDMTAPRLRARAEANAPVPAGSGKTD